MESEGNRQGMAFSHALFFCAFFGSASNEKAFLRAWEAAGFVPFQKNQNDTEAVLFPAKIPDIFMKTIGCPKITYCPRNDVWTNVWAMECV